MNKTAQITELVNSNPRTAGNSKLISYLDGYFLPFDLIKWEWKNDKKECTIITLVGATIHKDYLTYDGDSWSCNGSSARINDKNELVDLMML